MLRWSVTWDQLWQRETIQCHFGHSELWKATASSDNRETIQCHFGTFWVMETNRQLWQRETIRCHLGHSELWKPTDSSDKRETIQCHFGHSELWIPTSSSDKGKQISVILDILSYGNQQPALTKGNNSVSFWTFWVMDTNRQLWQRETIIQCHFGHSELWKPTDSSIKEL